MDTRRTHAYIMLDVTRDPGVRILSHRAALVQRRAKSNMLPAGFEPASEARKAPILDRTRLRERNGWLAA